MCCGTCSRASTQPKRLAHATMKPTTEIDFSGDEAARMQKLLDALEAIDDVQDVYTTAVLENA